MSPSLFRVRSRLRSAAWRLAQPPRFLPPPAVQCLKVALACGVVWWLGPLLHMPQPFNAALAVIILMQGHAYGSLLNALEFLLGVAAGLLLGIVVHLLFGISPLTLAGIMFVCLLMGSWLKVASQGFNNQIAISALLVLASGSADNVSRLWETVLGGAVGVVVAALLWPPNPLAQIRHEYRELKAQLEADVLRSLELAGRPDRAADAEANRRSAREHSERADAAVASVGTAEEALRWNPWYAGGLQDLSRLEDRLRLISYLYRTVRALARQAAKAAPAGDAEGAAGAGTAAAAWESARPDLLAAGSELVLAVGRRLVGEDAGDSVGRGREAVDRFAEAVGGEHRAAALSAVLEDLLSDVEGWRPDKTVDPDRLLVTRVLRRLGRQAPFTPTVAAEGHREFEQELGQARLRLLTGLLTGQPRTAPVLEDVVEAAGITGEADLGVRDIPLDHVKGSEHQALDFDVSLLPRSPHVRPRWVRLYAELAEGRPIAPVEVYRVGGTYFVKNGHHRISVARRLGWERIPAHVVEITTRAPVGSDLTAKELLRAAEYARFLERTELDRVRPQARLDCSQLGRYDVIFDHILGHRYFLGVEDRLVSVREAAASWYDSVYRPLTEVAREHDLGARLPGWTEADVYLALTRLWLDLEAEGRPAGPEGAAMALLADLEGDGSTPAPPLGRRRRSRAGELRWWPLAGKATAEKRRRAGRPYSASHGAQAD
jgi:uncharacterized membrane protein YgaE (UPF0421/DUF939 family)